MVQGLKPIEEPLSGGLFLRPKMLQREGGEGLAE